MEAAFRFPLSAFRFQPPATRRRAPLDIPANARETGEVAEVVFTPEARDQTGRLPRRIHGRVLSLALRLEKWPEVSGAKPLTGSLAGHWRMRTGDYRLQFRLEGETVLIEKVGHRDGFYGD